MKTLRHIIGVCSLALVCLIGVACTSGISIPPPAGNGPHPISYEWDEHTQQIGYVTATADKGLVIYLHPIKWGEADPAVQMFVVGHELGHVELGHLFERPKDQLNAELDADCFAIQWMAATGYLNASSLATVLEWLSGLEGGDTHPIGNDRAFVAMQCAP